MSNRNWNSCSLGGVSLALVRGNHLSAANPRQSLWLIKSQGAVQSAT